MPFFIFPPPVRTILFPYTTLFRSSEKSQGSTARHRRRPVPDRAGGSAVGRRENRLLELEPRSEEHTSELQSHVNLVCRLLLEKKNGLESPVPARASNPRLPGVQHR